MSEGGEGAEREEWRGREGEGGTEREGGRTEGEGGREREGGTEWEGGRRTEGEGVRKGGGRQMERLRKLNMTVTKLWALRIKKDTCNYQNLITTQSVAKCSRCNIPTVQRCAE